MGRGVDHLEGKPVETEAVMLVFATPDGRNLLSLRICRYPTENTTWLWARVITAGGRWSRYDNYLSCAPVRSAVESDDVTYSLADDSLVYRRKGPRANPSVCRADGTLLLTPEGAPAESAPPVLVEVHATFAPRQSHADYSYSRTEIMGLARAEIRSEGSHWALEGLGHFHEQPQIEPRFTGGFTYASFWGETISGVTVFSEGPVGGYLYRRGQATRVAGFQISAPMQHRSLRFDLSGGETLNGTADVVHEHSILIYGKPWYGHFVTGEIAGEPFAGMINDWRAATLPYVS